MGLDPHFNGAGWEDFPEVESESYSLDINETSKNTTSDEEVFQLFSASTELKPGTESASGKPSIHQKTSIKDSQDPSSAQTTTVSKQFFSGSQEGQSAALSDKQVQASFEEHENSSSVTAEIDRTILDTSDRVISSISEVGSVVKVFVKEIDKQFYAVVDEVNQVIEVIDNAALLALSKSERNHFIEHGSPLTKEGILLLSEANKEIAGKIREFRRIAYKHASSEFKDNFEKWKEGTELHTLVIEKGLYAELKGKIAAYIDAKIEELEIQQKEGKDNKKDVDTARREAGKAVHIETLRSERKWEDETKLDEAIEEITQEEIQRKEELEKDRESAELDHQRHKAEEKKADEKLEKEKIEKEISDTKADERHSERRREERAEGESKEAA